jgi:hypothetical protein
VHCLWIPPRVLFSVNQIFTQEEKNPQNVSALFNCTFASGWLRRGRRWICWAGWTWQEPQQSPPPLKNHPLSLSSSAKHNLRTVKKGYSFSRPHLGCHWLNSLWSGFIKLFPTTKRLVSDIPAGDGKISNFFYSAPISTITYFKKI